MYGTGDYNMKKPKIGDEIYVPTALFIGHGKDDRMGGKAQIYHVEDGISDGKPTIYISVYEHPNIRYNWKHLEERQDELKETYGDYRARMDPDYREEFNEDW